jgi:beta-glucosidase
VVVLHSGAPVIVPWAGKVKAVLEMWNAGQEGGTATARLLLGQASPSGHTPLTWPLKETDTTYAFPEPAGGLYPGSGAGPHPERLNGLPGGGSAWTQGLFVGYRYYDKLGIPVRFPFGHGLTYTTLRYEGLVVERGAEGEVRVGFTVRNVGKVAGTAVPQVYLGPAPEVPTGVLQAVRALRGFERVDLEPGEARPVSISLGARSFQYWSTPAQAWVTAPGERKLWVGEGLGDLRLTGVVPAAR